jgi:hypothetical protein
MRILDTNRKFLFNHSLYTCDYIFLNLDTGNKEQWSAHSMTGLNTLLYRNREIEFVKIID